MRDILRKDGRGMPVAVLRLQRFLHRILKALASDNRKDGHHLFYLNKRVIRIHLAYRQAAGIRNLHPNLSKDHRGILTDPVLIDFKPGPVFFPLQAHGNQLLCLLRRKKVRALLLYVVEESLIIALCDKSLLFGKAQDVVIK